MKVTVCDTKNYTRQSMLAHGAMLERSKIKLVKSVFNKYTVIQTVQSYNTEQSFSKLVFILSRFKQSIL